MDSVKTKFLPRRKLSQNKRKISFKKYLILPSKIIRYFIVFLHIIFRVQPYFSIFLAILISVPLALGFTQSMDMISQSKKSTIYKEGVTSFIKQIDPLPLSSADKPFSQLNRDISRLVFDPLFTTDSTGQLIGNLAGEYHTNDGSNFTVKLRDRKWSDGKEVTSQDVEQTFKTIKSIGPTCLYYSSIEGVDTKIIDNKTISFTLSIPNSAFLESLYWPILPSTILISKYSDILTSSFVHNPITDTGWKIDNITDQYIILHSPSNRLLKIIFYNNTFELSQALNAGNIDGYYSLDKINEKNYTNVYKYVLPRQLYSLYFNLSDSGSPVIKDPNVRKAISYAISRKEIVDGIGNIRSSIIQESSWAFSSSVSTYATDIDKANRILDDAGFKKEGIYRKFNSSNNLEFDITVPDIKPRIIQGEIIQQELKKIGVKVNIKPVKNVQVVDNEIKQNVFYNTVVLPQKFDAMIYSIDSNLDPDKFSQWHSSKIPNLEKNIIGLNFTGYSNLRVDAYLKQGRVQYDQAMRKVSYAQFQKVFYDDPPVVALFNPYVFYVTNKKVKNMDFTTAIRIEDRFSNFDKWVF